MTARLRGSAARILLGAALLVGGSAAPAHAEVDAVSAQTRDLCDGARVACSVQADPVLLEDTTGEVAVTGRSDVTVPVRAFRLDAAGVLSPFGPVVEVTTDGQGFGVADLRLPAVADGESGGPVLLAPEDSPTDDLAAVLGAWTVLASRRPTVLGDGYAAAKPVGTRIAVELLGAAPDASYDVQLERDGDWESIALGEVACADPATVCVVPYEVPRGLAAEAHRVRLVHRDSGTPVSTWPVLPSEDGEPADRTAPTTPAVGDDVEGSAARTYASAGAIPRPRSQDLDQPDIASDVEGASGPVVHDPATVHRAVVGLGLLALVVAVAGGVSTVRHRPGPRVGRIRRPGGGGDGA